MKQHEANYGSTVWCMQRYLILLNGYLDRYVQSPSEEERKRYAQLITGDALALVNDALSLERGEE